MDGLSPHQPACIIPCICAGFDATFSHGVGAHHGMDSGVSEYRLQMESILYSYPP